MEDEDLEDASPFSKPPDSQTFVDMDVQSDENHGEDTEHCVATELEYMLSNPVESD